VGGGCARLAGWMGTVSFHQSFATGPPNGCKPPLQTFATAIANVCGENLFLPCFSAEPKVLIFDISSSSLP
ncbi:MAG: hypothetical protein SPF79_07640, partial [Bacteroidaceae bacterium]|nr:hypothetical protein [Bacteroidaceae bacterium]